jgi:hypothetical protein
MKNNYLNISGWRSSRRSKFYDLMAAERNIEYLVTYKRTRAHTKKSPYLNDN